MTNYRKSSNLEKKCELIWRFIRGYLVFSTTLGISFHPVVVIGLGNDLLFNFIVGHCVKELPLPYSAKTKQKTSFESGKKGNLIQTLSVFLYVV